MIRAINRNTTATMAVCAALVCGSPVLFAQETVIAPTAEPTSLVQAAPAEPAAVVPPLVVRTIPDEMLAEPVVPAAVEKAEPRRAIAKPAPVRAVAAPKAATPPVTDIVEPAPPVAEEPLPTGAIFEDNIAIAPVAPIDQPALDQSVDDKSEDWMIFGGLAAALGLAGLGAGLAARRRRGRANINALPVLATPVAKPDYPAAPAIAAAYAVTPPQRVAQPSFAAHHLPPVTDPLFAFQAKLEPITDPLFAHEAVAPAVTDPFFADHPDYVGRSSAFDTRRNWASGPTITRPTVRELEPAE